MREREMKQGYRVLALFLIAAEAAAGYGLVRNFLTLPVQEERFLNGISASSLLETNSGQGGEEGTESGWTQPSEDQTAAHQSETSAPEGEDGYRPGFWTPDPALRFPRRKETTPPGRQWTGT